jgi:hypothetical protein
MLMKKFVGKPYAGKPHVRIDEGVEKELHPSRSTLQAWWQEQKIATKAREH